MSSFLKILENKIVPYDLLSFSKSDCTNRFSILYLTLVQIWVKISRRWNVLRAFDPKMLLSPKILTLKVPTRNVSGIVTYLFGTKCLMVCIDFIAKYWSKFTFPVPLKWVLKVRHILALYSKPHLGGQMSCLNFFAAFSWDHFIVWNFSFSKISFYFSCRAYFKP